MLCSYIFMHLLVLEVSQKYVVNLEDNITRGLSGTYSQVSQNRHGCTSEMFQKALSRLVTIYAHGVFINVDIKWLWNICIEVVHVVYQHLPSLF